MLPPIKFTLGERVKLNATGVEFTLKFQEIKKRYHKFYVAY